MTKSLFTTAFTLSLFAAAPALRSSETLGVLPDSGQSMGMVGGRLANLSDPSAVRQSPTNILSLDRPEMQVNFGAWHGDVRFTSTSDQSVQIDNPWKYLGSLYIVQPINPGRSAFGIGVSAPFGLSSYWPQTGYLRYLIPYQATLLTLDINPVFAFRVTDRFSAAVGLDLMYSSVDLKQFYPWSAITGPGAGDGTLRFQGDGYGIGAFGALKYEITEHQRVTVIGRLPINVKYYGTFQSSGMPPALNAAGFTAGSKFSSELTFPASIAVGYGIDITDRLSLGTDFQFTWNSSQDNIPLTIGKNQALLGASGLMVNWRDSYDIGIGGQYKINDHWTARAGYMFSEWSQQERYYTPSVPGSDRHLFSLGAGWRGEHHRIDLSWSYAYFVDRNVANDAQPAFDGHYHNRWNILTLSYGYRF